uniref:Uncharacterized protein n=1 Tax=Romanomermis culicivorax TaxID=13658 RepID=A0A915K181_ROMCU
MYDLTYAQCPVDKQLKDAKKNQIMCPHLGAEAIQWFKHSLAMDQIPRMPHSKTPSAATNQ